MRKLLCVALSAATFCIADYASADPVRAGFGVDLGVPSGVAAGVVVNPALDWARLQASLTYDYLSPGGRLSLQLDPMALIQVQHRRWDNPELVWYKRDFPFGVFADVQGGFQPLAAIPGHDNLPKVGFDYLNLYGGIRLGNPNGFHWNLEAGPTYMHVITSNFQAVLNGTNTNGLVLGNPHVNGWFAPTFDTGFTVVWQ